MEDSLAFRYGRAVEIIRGLLKYEDNPAMLDICREMATAFLEDEARLSAALKSRG